MKLLELVLYLLSLMEAEKLNFWKNLHPLLRQGKSAYGTANYAVLHSLADSLSDAERDTIAKKIQSNFKTATGDYLDIWGSWFHVIRRSNESDDDFRQRIMYYLLIPRSTIKGIIAGIQYYLDDNNAKVSVYEPWKNIFKTNNSLLNGPDHLQGTYYRYGVIDVNIDRPMSQAIYDAIQAFKPAGVKFYVTINQGMSADAKDLVLGELKVKNMNVIQKMYGFTYASKLPVTFADRADTLVPITDYFKTNNSALNGKDVLAGSPLHNVTYWNSLKTSDSQYKDVPVNFAIASHASGSNTTSKDAYPIHMQLSEDLSGKTITTVAKVVVTNYQGKVDSTNSMGPYIDVKDGISTGNWTGLMNQIPITGNGVYTSSPRTITKNSLTGTANQIDVEMYNLNATIEVWIKVEIGTTASPWSPNPADQEYYEATDVQRSILSNDNYPYVTLPYSSYEKYPTNLLLGSGTPQTVPAGKWGDNPNLVLDTSHLKIGDAITFQVEVNSAKTIQLFMALNSKQVTQLFYNGAETYTITWTEELSKLSQPVVFSVKTAKLTDDYTWSKAKAEIGTTASPWSPNPADPGYYLNMIDGQLSIYNLLTTKYAGLLNTYAGSTSYDKVKSLIADSNVSLGIVTNTDSPISINGTNISKGKQSVIIDKSSVVYTASDIYIPVTVTGTSDTNMHYLVANINVKKSVPGLGMSIIAQQMQTKITN